jgi:hypothetical protein
LTLVTALALLTERAQARELQGRLGLGYNAQFATARAENGSPSFALKYALTREVAIEAIAGISTASPTNATLGAKFFRTIFFDTSANFYFVAGAGLLNAGSRSGFQLLGGFGAEFFIPGVESVGISMEAGAGLDNFSGDLAFKTMGASFLEAGMRFYL